VTISCAHKSNSFDLIRFIYRTACLTVVPSFLIMTGSQTKQIHVQIVCHKLKMASTCQPKSWRNTAGKSDDDRVKREVEKGGR